MKLYLVSAYSQEEDQFIGKEWVGSQADAAAARKRFTEQGAKRKELMTREVEVPTKKEELLTFLNGLADAGDGYFRDEPEDK